MPKKSTEALIDLIMRAFLLLPINIAPVLPFLGKMPLTIYSLASIISVDLLPLSAFPKIEGAATWLLWIFIALVFASAGWKQMILYLAIGGIAMGFISSLGIFAVADAEVTASYTQFVQGSNIKNNTANTVGNFWLMLSNPRLWYEQNYGYKNDTLAQGLQASPFALEITKSAVLENVAPPDGKVTLDIQLKNRGLRDAILKKIDVFVEGENLGDYSGKANYNRYTRNEALLPENKDKGYLYFQSTPEKKAHYRFCDNPYFVPNTGNSIPEGFLYASKVQAYKDFTSPANPEGTVFEPSVLDEYFVEIKSPKCYGRERVNATITYSYNVSAIYNLELINRNYFTELAKYNKLKFHIEDSQSSEGPLKLTIRSVPEEQPVRLSDTNTITVFYSLSNIGPGTVVIKDAKDVYLEDLDGTLALAGDETCDFEKGATPDPTKAYLKNQYVHVSKFFLKEPKDVPISETCTLPGDEKGETQKCITLSDQQSTVLMKCAFTYDAAKYPVEKTKTLFLKMHVKYDYITAKKVQYDITPMPGFHACVNKRSLDGFPNKTMMDLYLQEVFKDTKWVSVADPFTAMNSEGLPEGDPDNPVKICPSGDY